MEVSIIKIGNSKGIRFSKTLIEKYNIKDLITNPDVQSLTYSQIRNIDYAIENNQIEELFYV